MTAHLENACREIDDLLLECLLTWSGEVGLPDENVHLASIHGFYVERSSRLIEARSAIEMALRALGPGTESRSEGNGRHPATLPRSKTSMHPGEAPVSRSEHHSGHRSIHGDHSSSRPDRPQRPRAICRGEERDWNRDILACRPEPWGRSVAGSCGCSHKLEERDPSGPETAAGRDDGFYEASSPPPDRLSEEDLDGQQSYEAFVKEPENGTQGKSTRSRKRG